MSFNLRSAVHDQVAIPEVIKELELHHYKAVRQGHEFDNSELRGLLAGSRHITGLMKRFKPDLLAMKQDTGSILLIEVKCDLGNHSNFAIEFDSYVSMVEHGKSHDAIYAFVDTKEQDPLDYIVTSSAYCELHYIPFPNQVFIPKRRDYLETYQYIKDKYPTVHPTIKEYTNGSGTAYFLVEKRSSFFKPWSKLSTARVLQLDLFGLRVGS